jgi:3-hydroxyisobutyrate dehydrogenase-like beta-hydroxyacid dehydrogenase
MMMATEATVGLMHPGSMGAAFAAQLRSKGTTVLWCPTGRSESSRQRAEQASMEPVTSLTDLLERVDVLLSLCPPAAAEDVAAQVAAHGFRGTYVEANAITPRRVRNIAECLPYAAVVDGAVVGSPPVGGKSPTLYLAGPREQVVRLEDLFAGTDVQTHPLGDDIGQASALKLAYSSYQKASRVLAAVAYGLADANGVSDELLHIASKRTGSYLTETAYIPKTASRAWRWAPELEDAADLLVETGLPGHLMHAVAEVLHSWDEARDTSLTISEALALLRDDRDAAGTTTGQEPSP